jgi:hypothetical protein
MHGGDIMESQHYANRSGWTIILYGTILSFISAFTPLFVTAYLFKGDIFLAGLLPYLIYAIAVPLLPGKTTTALGITLAAVHTSLIVAVRFLEFSNILIYTIPIILAILLIPLAVVAVIKTDIHKPEQKILRH